MAGFTARNRLAACTALLVLCGAGLYAQAAGSLFSTDFRQGEDLFLRNRPGEALGFLEKAVSLDPGNITACLYLAAAYEQLGRIDNAITVYKRILPIGGGQTALIAYNMGNAYYNKGTAIFAEQCYTQAIEADPGYASAYLNRANTRIKTGEFQAAMPDYQYYLALEPRSPKRPQIERLLALLEDEVNAAERRRQAAEAAAAARAEAEAAAARAEEARRLAEEERRKRLLEEVSASLQAATEDVQGFKADSENATGYTGEFELE